MEIKVELNQLEDCADKLSGIAQSLESVKDEVSRINGGVDDFWLGAAHDNFKTGNSELLEMLDSLSQQISTNHSKLVDSINIYRETEGMVQNNMNDLSTDNIF